MVSYLHATAIEVTDLEEDGNADTDSSGQNTTDAVLNAVLDSASREGWHSRADGWHLVVAGAVGVAVTSASWENHSLVAGLSGSWENASGITTSRFENKLDIVGSRGCGARRSNLSQGDSEIPGVDVS